MNVVWREFPSGLKEQVQRSVGWWAPVLPGWCAALEIDYDDTDTDNYATSTVLPEQRRALLHIHPMFWSLDDAGRDETIRHEFGHVLLGPIDDVMNGLVETLDGEPLRAWATEAYRLACEAVATDFAAAIQK